MRFEKFSTLIENYLKDLPQWGSVLAVVVLLGATYSQANAGHQTTSSTARCRASLGLAQKDLVESLRLTDLTGDRHLADFGLMTPVQAEKTPAVESSADTSSVVEAKPLSRESLPSDFFSRGDIYQQVFESSLPEARSLGSSEVTWSGKETPRFAAYVVDAARDFRKVVDTIREFQASGAKLQESLARDLVSEAAVRAYEFLHHAGVNVSLVLALDSRTISVELDSAGTHRLNVFARNYSRAHGGAVVRYDASLFLKASRITAFSKSRKIFFVNDEMILSPTLKNEFVLHELFHSLVEELARQGKSHPLHGVTFALNGRLPGLEDPYSSLQTHDEPLNYLRTLRNTLTLLTGAIAGGDAAKAQAAYMRTQSPLASGYTTAKRNEKIAEQALEALKAKASQPVFEIENERLVAVLKLGDAINSFESRIPLVTLDRKASESEKLAALTAQLQSMLEASRSLAIEFDFALRVFHRIVDAFEKHDVGALWLGSRALQSALRPIDLSTGAIAQGKTLKDLVDSFNNELEIQAGRVK